MCVRSVRSEGRDVWKRKYKSSNSNMRGDEWSKVEWSGVEYGVEWSGVEWSRGWSGVRWVEWSGVRETEANGGQYWENSYSKKSTNEISYLYTCTHRIGLVYSDRLNN